MTSRKFGMPTNVRLSANKWYSVSCGIGFRLNAQMSEPRYGSYQNAVAPSGCALGDEKSWIGSVHSMFSY